MAREFRPVTWILTALGVACVTAAVVVLWPVEKSGREAPSVVAIGKLAPDFTLTDISDGEDVSLSDFEGKVVLINFFATWCGPCRFEIPSFVKAQAEYGDKFVILAVSLDQNPRDVLPGFVRNYKMNFPVVYGSRESLFEIVAKYGEIPAIPTSFLVDRNGDVVKRHRGVYRESDLKRDLEKVLG